MHDLKFWRDKLMPYTKKSNAIAYRQVFLTLLPFALLWVAYSHFVKQSLWYALPFALITSLFILRSFVLMHDCGHKAMFQSQQANKFFGFLFGVVTGMPEAVWSKNHAYHHKTNGDWVKYGGVFSIITTDKYKELTDKQKRNYWLFRQPLILIPAGFFYVLFFPRFNWIVGHFAMLYKILKPLITFKFSEASAVAKKWETKFWKSKDDYKHMTYNNLTLLAIWALMIQWLGAAEFFTMYVISTSLSGSFGILLFTIQHNFEDSYATDSERVNYCKAALEGTSMLILPRTLNWFTAGIAYHHIHHLSVAIPNYNLQACHEAYEDLFKDVKRAYMSDLLGTFEYQLWDPELQKVVSRYSLQN